MKPTTLTAGSIIATSWNLFRTHFNELVQPILMLVLIGAALGLGVTLPLSSTAPFVFLVVLMLAYIIVSIWLSVVFIKISDKLINGEKFSLPEIYQDSYRRGPKFLWISVVTGLAILGGFILLIIPGIIFSIWYVFTTVASALEEIPIPVKKMFAISRELTKNR